MDLRGFFFWFISATIIVIGIQGLKKQAIKSNYKVSILVEAVSPDNGASAFAINNDSYITVSMWAKGKNIMQKKQHINQAWFDFDLTDQVERYGLFWEMYVQLDECGNDMRNGVELEKGENNFKIKLEYCYE